MNPNTRLRLWKEARALLPTWAVMMALTVGCGWMGVTYHNETALNCFLLAGIGGCWLLGAVSVGHEFDNRTLGLALSQPICRSRLWAEKMLVLSVAVGTLWWLAPVISFSGGRFVPSLDLVSGLASVLAVAICVAPALTLLARSTIGGAALTLSSPFLLLLAVMAVSLLVTHYRLRNNLEELTSSTVVVTDYTPVLAALLVVYCGSLAWFGWRKFVRWEENQSVPSQLTLPPSLTQLADGLRSSVSLGRRSAWGSLVRKELGLQQAAFLVAIGLIALWLALLVAVTFEPAWGREILTLPLVLMALGIPIIVGITSTAEERSLGVHGWHLTLPVSVRRQWSVKLAVALAVNAGLGIALPSLLGHMTIWWADLPHLTRELNGNFNVFATANLIILLAACFASTFSPNVLRAMIGTIVVLVAVGLFSVYVLPPIERHQYRYWAWARAWGQASASVIAPERLWPMVQWYGYARMAALGSGVLLLGWLVWRAAICNFRGATIPWWIPARQLGCLALATYCYWFLRGFEPHFLGGLFETIRVGH